MKFLKRRWRLLLLAFLATLAGAGAVLPSGVALAVDSGKQASGYAEPYGFTMKAVSPKAAHGSSRAEVTVEASGTIVYSAQGSVSAGSAEESYTWSSSEPTAAQYALLYEEVLEEVGASSQLFTMIVESEAGCVAAPSESPTPNRYSWQLYDL